MKLQLVNAGKRFESRWIFRGIDLCIEQGGRQVIVGANGSGKSSLLKMAAGFLSLSRGSIAWSLGGSRLEQGELYRHVSLAAPYLELIEELSLEEHILFHNRFKSFLAGVSPGELMEISGLKPAGKTPVSAYSSGMKQRLRLLLAILTDSSLLLLDEPCSHLDAEAIKWYQQLLADYAQERTIIVASNHTPSEYPGFKNVFSL